MDNTPEVRFDKVNSFSRTIIMYGYLFLSAFVAIFYCWIFFWLFDVDPELYGVGLEYWVGLLKFTVVKPSAYEWDRIFSMIYNEQKTDKLLK